MGIQQFLLASGGNSQQLQPLTSGYLMLNGGSQGVYPQLYSTLPNGNIILAHNDGSNNLGLTELNPNLNYSVVHAILLPWGAVASDWCLSDNGMLYIVGYYRSQITSTTERFILQFNTQTWSLVRFKEISDKSGSNMTNIYFIKFLPSGEIAVGTTGPAPYYAQTFTPKVVYIFSASLDYIRGYIASVGQDTVNSVWATYGNTVFIPTSGPETNSAISNYPQVTALNCTTGSIIWEKVITNVGAFDLAGYVLTDVHVYQNTLYCLFIKSLYAQAYLVSMNVTDGSIISTRIVTANYALTPNYRCINLFATPSDLYVGLSSGFLSSSKRSNILRLNRSDLSFISDNSILNTSTVQYRNGPYYSIYSYGDSIVLSSVIMDNSYAINGIIIIMPKDLSVSTWTTYFSTAFNGSTPSDVTISANQTINYVQSGITYSACPDLSFDQSITTTSYAPTFTMTPF